MALDEATAWDADTYIGARISDGIELANYLFIQANSASDAKPMPLPEPIQRPGQPEKAEPTKPNPEDFASGHEVAAFFSKMSSL
jgi:hypothetical protein